MEQASEGVWSSICHYSALGDAASVRYLLSKVVGQDPSPESLESLRIVLTSVVHGSDSDVSLRTPLHYAADSGHTGTMDVFLQCFPDEVRKSMLSSEAVDSYGLSPRDIALACGHDELLRHYGFMPSVVPPEKVLLWKKYLQDSPSAELLYGAYLETNLVELDTKASRFWSMHPVPNVTNPCEHRCCFIRQPPLTNDMFPVVSWDVQKERGPHLRFSFMDGAISDDVIVAACRLLHTIESADGECGILSGFHFETSAEAFRWKLSANRSMVGLLHDQASGELVGLIACTVMDAVILNGVLMDDGQVVEGHSMILHPSLRSSGIAPRLMISFFSACAEAYAKLHGAFFVTGHPLSPIRPLAVNRTFHRPVSSQAVVSLLKKRYWKIPTGSLMADEMTLYSICQPSSQVLVPTAKWQTVDSDGPMNACMKFVNQRLKRERLARIFSLGEFRKMFLPTSFSYSQFADDELSGETVGLFSFTVQRARVPGGTDEDYVCAAFLQLLVVDDSKIQLVDALQRCLTVAETAGAEVFVCSDQFGIGSTSIRRQLGLRPCFGHCAYLHSYNIDGQVVQPEQVFLSFA